MSTNGTPRDPHLPRHEPDVAEQNLARLLGRAYQPEHPAAEFVQKLHQTLQATAREAARARRPVPWRSRRLGALAAAAALAGIIFGLHVVLQHPSGGPDVGGDPGKSHLPNGTAVLAGSRPADETYLTPRRRPPSQAAPRAAVGDTLATEAGQQRRVALPDGSLLYLNQQTTVRLTGLRQVALDRGEVFVEVAPREPGADGATFVVQAAGREVSALGTRFAVRAADAGPAVVVTQGKVKVSGVEAVVAAGQQLTPGSHQPAAAPRASYVLDWARDLIAQADAPLVPASKFAGGALIAMSPDGQEAKISLRKYHIDVHVEDGFARTTIDQTYFNHETRRLEGKFLFPLPADAQLSRLAMYVDGNLMEGGMVERQEARAIFESIVRKMQDPALLEWVDGTTFSMRVFPLEGRQEKRIVLSYVQKLSSLYGRMRYRFPAGHSLGEVRDWSFHAVVKNGAGLTWTCPSHTLTPTMKDGDLLLDAAAKNATMDRDVVLELTDPTPAAEPVRFSAMEHEGARYLMLRYRPSLPGKAQRQRRDWVFLVESSAQRDPLLARVQIDIVRTLLANAEHDDTFQVLTAAARVRAFADKPLPATRANTATAVAWLENSHLVGGLDLAGALDAAAVCLQKMDNPYLVHLGSGVPTLGEHRDEALARRVPEGSRYVGVAVGKRWNRGFMKTAAERSGGLFTQINPDEPIAWRAFELFCTLGTPRLVNLQVVDDAEAAVFLCHDTTLSQGEELCAVTRVEGADLPLSVSVSAVQDGKPFRKSFPVKDVARDAGYLPRTWAKLEIDRLLAQDAGRNKSHVIELSKAMYVMTPYTSLLVLENEAMYAQYKVDRGRKDHWAMYPCPPKIPVVHEPMPPRSESAPPIAGSTRVPAEQVLRTIPGGTVGVRELFSQPLNLTNPDIGLNPEIPLNYNIDRIEDVSVPGPVDPSQAIGIPGAPPDAPVANVPAPPGFNGGFGMSLPGTAPVAPALTGPMGLPGGGRPAPPLPGGVTVSPPPVPAPAQPAAPPAPTPSSSAVPPGLPSVLPTGAGGAGAAPPAPTTTVPVPPGYGFGGGFGGGQGQGGGTSPSGEGLFGNLTGGMGQPQKDSMGGDGRGPGLADHFQKKFKDLETWRLLIKKRGNSQALLYQRPQSASHPGLYSNLLSFAPGLSNSRADLLAVLEAEAIGHEAAPGQVDLEAQALIEKARQTGWRQVTLLSAGGKPAWSLLCDGGGKYTWERTVAGGLKERVVCDGTDLWHLYPELGLAAHRTVSRFHTLELATLVPWVLPSAADLARGADVKRIAPRTVAVVPHKGAAELHLVFGADDRLTERRLMAGGAELVRDACDPSALAGRMLIKPVKAPSFKPALDDLLVLPLPVRTREHIVATQLPRFGNDATALALALAEYPRFSHDCLTILRFRFAERPNLHRGLTTLLCSSEVGWSAFKAWFNGQKDDPVYRYGGWLRSQDAEAAAELRLKGESLLPRLQTLAALLRLWEDRAAIREAEAKQLEDFLTSEKSPLLAWALLEPILTNPERPVAAAGGRQALLTRLLQAASQSLDESPLPAYAVRFELARALDDAGQEARARQILLDAYNAAWREGLFPPIDGRFRQIVGPSWEPLMKQTCQDLLAAGRYDTAVALARQCVAVGDPALAETLAREVVERSRPTPARVSTTLAVIEFLWHQQQHEAAVQKLDELLSEPALALRPKLWRLRAWMDAAQPSAASPSRKQFEALDRALELEFREPPETIDLREVRREYGLLLSHYGQLAVALSTLQQPAPPDLVQKVVRAADRWRALDTSPAAACQTAGRVLRQLGQDDLAWDYLTSSLPPWSPEHNGVLNLARELRNAGDLKTADRAFILGIAADPDNYALFWERIQNLRQAGDHSRARQLLQALAENSAAPLEYRIRARRELDAR